MSVHALLLLSNPVAEDAACVFRFDQMADREVLSIEEAIQMEKDVTTDWREVLWPK
jgi:hypothetical protein